MLAAGNREPKRSAANGAIADRLTQAGRERGGEDSFEEEENKISGGEHHICSKYAKK